MFSRAALAATICYTVLVGVLLIATWRVSDFEGRAYDLLFIGFPWVLVIPSNFYFASIVANIATVYALALAVVKLVASIRN